jgi:hypothetical protein
MISIRDKLFPMPIPLVIPVLTGLFAGKANEKAEAKKKRSAAAKKGAATRKANEEKKRRNR